MHKQMQIELEDMKRFSKELAQVMGDIGVNEELVSLRRHLTFIFDRYAKIHLSYNGFESCKYLTFGSQSEGSTTIGMMSDIDKLFYSEDLVACVRLSECQDGKSSYFVIKEPTSLPQSCCLQAVVRLQNNTYLTVSKDNILPTAKICEKNYIFDQQGRLLLNSVFLLNYALIKFANRVLRQHGPAISHHTFNMDCVVAIRCMTSPDNCKYLFTRPRPCHWPTQGTLSKAEQCEVFMVNPGVQGHTFGYEDERQFSFIKLQYQHKFVDSQFRMSTNKTERLLMFDLNIIQMKAYVLTKMIRKEFLQPLVDERLSTYHMKTALFFTIEQYPEDIWTNDNLVQCVIYCLITLKRFLKRRYCPHFNIGSVNLFADKLKVYEVKIVKDKVTEMINSDLSCLRTLCMDHLEKRLSMSVKELNNHKILSGKEMRIKIINSLIGLLDSHLTALSYGDLETQHSWALAVHLASTTDHEYGTELEFLYQNVCSIIASRESSECIANGTELTSDIINMYETSLRSKTVSNHLRYASMLVCTQQFERAIGVLNQIAPAITSTNAEDDLYDVHNRSTPSETLMYFAATIVLPVVFERNEINCVPNHLTCIYETFRTITEDEITGADLSKLRQFKFDGRSFFYYLQYLSSRNKGNQRHALANLTDYCESKVKNKTSNNLNTELNMLGHVYALENSLPAAWKIYRASVSIQPHCNAAYWHLFRIFGKVVYGTI